MTSVEERKILEKKLVNILIRRNKPISFLPRNYRGRMISTSPSLFREISNMDLDSEVFYKYSNLSRNIHKYSDSDRVELEDYIVFDLIGFKKKYNFIHLLFNEICKGYESYRRICIEKRIAYKNKNLYKQIVRNINKWRDLSQKDHYELSKQEKRKLKKLYNKHMAQQFEEYVENYN